MTVSEIIALASVTIAGLALWRSRQAGREAAKATAEANDLLKQQVELQARVASIEESREQTRIQETLQANLRAELRTTDQKSVRLFVQNIGNSPARKVAITLDGQPILEHGVVPRGEQEKLLIGPKSEESFLIAMGMDCGPPFEFEATWDDDSGKQRLYNTMLTY